MGFSLEGVCWFSLMLLAGVGVSGQAFSGVEAPKRIGVFGSYCEPKTSESGRGESQSSVLLARGHVGLLRREVGFKIGRFRNGDGEGEG